MTPSDLANPLADRDEITIRPAETTADYEACQDAQRQAWGITDDTYILPLATMVGAQHHGGLVLGAFRPDGAAVGLSFAFLGKVRGRPCLYSQLTGIVPNHQGTGLGHRLKLAQRAFAAREGIPRLAWSFDPLQSRNAHFNLNHLGATAVQYVEDMYGRRSDALNAGAATDRLIVEWSTTAHLTPHELPASGELPPLPRLIQTRDRPDGAVEPTGVDPDFLLGPDPALIEIPSTIATIRQLDPVRAEAWTIAVRTAFQAAFAAGRVATGFLRTDVPTRRRYFYVVRSADGLPDDLATPEE